MNETNMANLLRPPAGRSLFFGAAAMLFLQICVTASQFLAEAPQPKFELAVKKRSNEFLLMKSVICKYTWKGLLFDPLHSSAGEGICRLEASDPSASPVVHFGCTYVHVLY